MQSLAFKMLFRKKGTASAILAIALLVALLASVNCLVNNINSQTTALTQLDNLGQNYIVTDQNADSLSDSRVPSEAIIPIKNNSEVNYAISQKLIQATLSSVNENFTVTIRGVDDVQAFLKKNQASINGSVGKTEPQTNMGIILSKLTGINKNDNLTISINGIETQLKVVGVTQARQQSDAELIMPLSSLQNITQQIDAVSFIEFSIKDSSKADNVLANLTQTLPPQTKIVNTQQVVPFAQDINNQTVTFISVWSVSVYIVVIAASYIIVARVVNESEYELSILRNLGAKKKTAFTTIMLYMLTIAVLGSLIGLSLGIVGSQGGATAVRLVLGNAQLAPFLEVNQALQIVLLALVSALFGGIYPAIKGAQKVATEVTF